MNFLDIFDRAAAVGIDNRDSPCANSSNRSFDITRPGLRALKMAVTPTPRSAASCDNGASVAKPTPRPRTTMFFQSGLSLKPNAQRAGDIEVVTRCQHRHAAGSPSLYFVEKLDLRLRLCRCGRCSSAAASKPRRRRARGKADGSIARHRPLSACSCTLRIRCLYSSLTQSLATTIPMNSPITPLRIGIGIADAKRGSGVIPGEVQGHGVQVSHAIWQHCAVRSASV